MLNEIVSALPMLNLIYPMELHHLHESRYGWAINYVEAPSQTSSQDLPNVNLKEMIFVEKRYLQILLSFH